MEAKSVVRCSFCREANTARVSSGYNAFWGFGELHEKETRVVHTSAQMLLAFFPDQDPHQTAAREACEEVTAFRDFN